ncbi:MAG: hypothetical protein RLO12_04355 [Fulvivirga sp.]
MRLRLNYIAIGWMFFVLMGCSTIMKVPSEMVIKFTITDMPAQLIEVKDVKNGTMLSQTSGNYVEVKLGTKHKFFSRKKYVARFSRSGMTKTIYFQPRISKWYWLNIPLGIIWMFTVEPCTGKMYEFQTTTYIVDFNNP